MIHGSTYELLSMFNTWVNSEVDKGHGHKFSN